MTTPPDELLPLLVSLLGEETAHRVTIPGLLTGGNNRIYRIDLPERQLVLKRYFRHPHDLRDRLGVEFDFLSFLWNNGVRCIPEPVACDREQGAALYAFVRGERIVTAPDDREIDAVLAFLRQINSLRGNAGVGTLQDGSEACFSINGHIANLRSRLGRLSEMQVVDRVDHLAVEFVTDHLAPMAARLVEQSLRSADMWGMDPNRTLSPEERIISPSDFGFHNALRREDGDIIFLDFEYAGWDDPAKCYGDFFNQLAVPVPYRYAPQVSATLAELVSNSTEAVRRMELMLPLYAIKWSCIALNHFLPESLARRSFASDSAGEQRREQLAKAGKCLAYAEDLLHQKGA